MRSPWKVKPWSEFPLGCGGTDDVVMLWHGDVAAGITHMAGERHVIPPVPAESHILTNKHNNHRRGRGRLLRPDRKNEFGEFDKLQRGAVISGRSDWGICHGFKKLIPFRGEHAALVMSTDIGFCMGQRDVKKKKRNKTITQSVIQGLDRS